MTNTAPTSTSFGQLFPHPFLSLILAASWLMLTRQPDPAHILMALAVAIVIPKLTQFFIRPTEPVYWPSVFRLFFIVLWDIVIANLRVARQVLGPLDHLSPQWIRVPLDTKHPNVNTLLALIITTTPGTVSAGLEDDQQTILVHALNTKDSQSVITEIKTRYEQPLIKIFRVNTVEKPHDD